MARTDNQNNRPQALTSEPTPEEMAEIAEDLGPTPDQGNKPSYREDPYPIWDSTNSYVVSGPIGEAKFRGTRYDTWQEAKAATANRFSVIQFWTLGYRWFARVKRV